LAVSGCLNVQAPASKKNAKRAGPPEVTVRRPIASEVTDYFEFPGRTEAVNEVEIRSRVTGYIVKVCFDDGQAVKQGDVLFEIDPRPYQAILDRAKAELARLEAVEEKARIDVARSERLQPSGAVSRDEYEQNVAQLKITQAAIAGAKALATEAELNLEFTHIVSPIDGRVGRARVREGNLVQSGTNTASVLTTVVTTDPIYVAFGIDEQALLKYQELARRSGRAPRPSALTELRLPVEIGLANEEGFPRKGVLDFTDNQLDPATGTLRVRGVFDNPDESLTPGLFVRVRIPYGSKRTALLAPERAIGRDQKLRYVLTVNDDNVVEYRRITAGSLHDGLRVIDSGIEADDWIIVNGLQRVRPGDRAAPIREEKDAG